MTTTLALFGLMAMAGFAVDFGWWYSRAGQLQRAADAAALAGVVYMPNEFTTAKEVALETAAKNGFVDTDAGPNPGQRIDVIVTPGAVNQRLKVTIHDRDVELYFAAIFMDSLGIHRDAVGHYSEPIPLGSPENVFGIGDLEPTTFGGGTMPKQNYYAAVNGPCAAKEMGDRYLSHSDGNAARGGSPARCSGRANAEYDPEGYAFTVDLAASPSREFVVAMLDPGFTPGLGSQDYSFGMPDAETELDTHIEARLPDVRGTPYVYSDDPLIDLRSPATKTTCTASPSPPGADDVCRRVFASKVGTPGQTVPLFTLPAGSPPGRYRVRVWTTDAAANPGRSWGADVFAIGALPRSALNGNGAFRCTTLGPNPSQCPRVYAEDRMSIYANASGDRASLWLAQIAAVHAGKSLVIELWDPGEGGEYIEFDMPNGAKATFDWVADGGASGNDVTRLLLGTPCQGSSDPSYPQPFTDIAGRCQFNDRKIVVTIDIATNYDAIAANNGGWWKILYKFHAGTPVEDRTTWQIYVEGDPVHLVEE